ncbi:MAG: hypothetical protein WC234_07345 [Endomicrobiaceae bacterium]|jgi:hypothetical protein
MVQLELILGKGDSNMKFILSILLITFIPIFGTSNKSVNESISDSTKIFNQNEKSLVTKEILDEKNNLLQKDEINPESLSTSALVNRFLNDYHLSAFLGLLQEYDAKVLAILKNDVIIELLNRKDCINCLSKIYKDKLNSSEVLSKELLPLLISSKACIEKMNGDEKYEILKISYDIYLKKYENEEIPSGRSYSYPVLYLFTNILEFEGLEILPKDVTWNQKHDFSFRKQWTEILFLKTQEYLEIKEK